MLGIEEEAKHEFLAELDTVLRTLMDDSDQYLRMVFEINSHTSK